MNAISRFEITSKQLTFVLIGAMVATGILSLPRLVSAEAGQDSWIAVLLGAALPLVSLALIERLYRFHPQLSMSGLAHLLFGKICGTTLILAFVAYAVLFSSAVVRGFAEVIQTSILPQTPMSVVIFISVSTIVFIAGKGLKVAGRFSELLFPILLLFVLFPLITLPGADITNLLPPGGVGLREIVQGALATSFSYGGIEVLLLIYSTVTRKDEVLKAGMAAVGIVAFMYLLVTLLGLMIFGARTMQHVVWPTIKLFRVVDLPVFERPELIALTFWMLLGTRPAIVYACSISFVLVDLFRLDLEKHFPYVVCGLGLVMFFVSQIPRNLYQAFRLSTYAGYASLVFGVAYPAFFLLAALLRRAKGREK